MRDIRKLSLLLDELVQHLEIENEILKAQVERLRGVLKEIASEATQSLDSEYKSDILLQIEKRARAALFD